MTFCFALLLINPLLKRVNSKRKEFAPKRSKFFPFREESLVFESGAFLASISIPFKLLLLLIAS